MQDIQRTEQALKAESLTRIVTESTVIDNRKRSIEQVTTAVVQTRKENGLVKEERVTAKVQKVNGGSTAKVSPFSLFTADSTATLLEHIFSFASYYDLRCNIPATCKDWQRVSVNSNALWIPHLRYITSRYNAAEICTTIDPVFNYKLEEAAVDQYTTSGAYTSFHKAYRRFVQCEQCWKAIASATDEETSAETNNAAISAKAATNSATTSTINANGKNDSRRVESISPESNNSTAVVAETMSIISDDVIPSIDEEAQQALRDWSDDNFQLPLTLLTFFSQQGSRRHFYHMQFQPKSNVKFAHDDHIEEFGHIVLVPLMEHVATDSIGSYKDNDSEDDDSTASGNKKDDWSIFVAFDTKQQPPVVDPPVYSLNYTKLYKAKESINPEMSFQEIEKLENQMLVLECTRLSVFLENYALEHAGMEIDDEDDDDEDDYNDLAGRRRALMGSNEMPMGLNGFGGGGGNAPPCVIQ